jgi:hypothetical protein
MSLFLHDYARHARSIHAHATHVHAAQANIMQHIYTQEIIAMCTPTAAIVPKTGIT